MDVRSCLDPVDEVGNSFACHFPIQDQPDVDDHAKIDQRKLFSLPVSFYATSTTIHSQNLQRGFQKKYIHARIETPRY